jgi:hypothetical protein
MKTEITIIFILFFMGIGSNAQDKNEVNISLGTDIASSYLWRGLPQGTMPALQPWSELTYKGFSLGAWGSYELGGTFKEIDIYAKYTLNSFSLQFVDLYFPDFAGLNPDYFNYKNSETGHAAELALSFNGTSKIPFTVYGGMIVYGTAIDPKVSDAVKLNKSAYFEVNYLGSVKDVNYTIFAGLTPTESVLYGTSQFSFINVGLSLKKAIKITDQFSLPLKLTLAANPESNKFYMAA